MSRFSTLAMFLLGAAALTVGAPAQEREQVLETIRNLEASLGRLDDYINGLKTPRVDPARQEELDRLQQTLAAELQEYAQRAEAAETDLAQARQETARLQEQLDGTILRQRNLEASVETLRQRTADTEAELATTARDLERAGRDNAGLRQQLDEAAVAESEMQTLRQRAGRADTLEAQLVTAVRDLERARLDSAELQKALDEEASAAGGEVLSLRRRTEDAEAELAAERDLRAALQGDLQALRDELPAGAPTPQPVEISGAEGGLQIHIHGGEVTFHIDSAGLPRIIETQSDGEVRDTSNLHLRFRRDAADPGKLVPTGPRPPLRIHLP